MSPGVGLSQVVSRFVMRHPFRGAGRLRQAATDLLVREPAPGIVRVRTHDGLLMEVGPG